MDSEVITPGAIEKFMETLPEKLLHFGIKLVLAILVILIGIQLIKLIRKIVRKSLKKAHVEDGVVVFTDSLLKIILVFALIVIVVGTCGVEISSFLAVLGSVSVAIGFAWQGSLSNLAGGMLLLILKPFSIGDMILDEKGNEGIVDQIDIFYTRIITPDSKVIVLPNGPLANGSITNYSRCRERRMDIKVGISYQADIRKAKDVLLDMLSEMEGVQQNMEKNVLVDSLGDSSVNLIVRCFVNKEIYFPMKDKLTQSVKETLDKAEIPIPYPQMDVHFG